MFFPFVLLQLVRDFLGILIKFLDRLSFYLYHQLDLETIVYSRYVFQARQSPHRIHPLHLCQSRVLAKKGATPLCSTVLLDQVHAKVSLLFDSYEIQSKSSL